MWRTFALLAALTGVGVAFATPYWIDWDGTDWPENQGWTRNWGNWNGQYQGPGAYRTLENGILTYDSLYDPGVADFYFMERPGQIDPSPGEVFVMEWRLKIDVVNGAGDPGIAVFSDGAWALGYTYASDHLRSMFESYLSIPFEPGLWHEYRVTSADMRAYDLYIDGELAHHGTLEQAVTQSHVGWGDCAQGASSLHHWDYLRYGVVPEPYACHLMLLWVALWRGARRG
jgi:hypothetical protein